MIADEAAARRFVLDLSGSEAVARLDRLASLLADENRAQNLVAANSLDSLWQRHIADSAQLLRHVSRETPVWLDLGSGAGFPGLVIALMRPEWNVHLVESRRRRVGWLHRIIEGEGLANCTIHGCRLEQVSTFSADVISARAFAPLPHLLDLSARFSTPDTQWILPKGRSARQEIEQLPPILRKLFHVEQSLTGVDSGIVVGKGRVTDQC